MNNSTHMRYAMKFVFLGIPLGFILGLDARGIEPNALETSDENTSILSAYHLNGSVVDWTTETADVALDRLENALCNAINAAKSNGVPNDEANTLVENFLKPHGASNAMVRLIGESVQEETTSDSEGKFSFIGFSRGVYALSAEAPSLKAPGRIAKGRLRYDFSPGRSGNWAFLEIHAYPVTIKGRVTTSDGQPVANAKVTGGPVCLSDVKIYSDPDWREEGLARMRQYALSAETTSNGIYQLDGFIPPSIYEIAGYLGNGSDSLYDTGVPDTAFSRFYADIRVEVAGYTQRTVPRVPLVTETLLGPARRFLHMMLKLSDNPSNKEKLTGFQEKGEVLPSQGDTIPNIDIVMDPVMATESASQENPSPPLPPAIPK